MAAVDISAPVCETKEEQGGDLVDQATSILISKLPNEEQIEAHTHDGHSMVEGDNFLTAPSIGEVHCEVNNSSPDDSMVIEKPVQTVKDETDIVPLGKPKSDDQPTAKAGDVEPIEEDILEYSKSVAPENIEESILGQEKIIKSFPEDQSTNRTLNENAGGETDEKSIDAVDTQEEILENDFSNVSNEDVKGNSTEHGEPKNVEFCENESTKSTVVKIESKLEKPEDHLHATSEDINAPEIETRSCIEEQSVTTHPQGILDEKTEDEAVDAAEKEGTIENVPRVVSIEQMQDDSLIQVGGPKMETEDRLEKEAEQPSPVGDFTENIVTDEVKIDDRAELLEEEFTESVLLEEEVKQEKALKSLHAVGHLAEDPDSKQEESSVTKVPEVHMVISHENVADVANLASEVVEEEDSCGDKTVTKETAALDDGSTMIPANETLPETDPRGGTEAEVQVQDEVKIDDRAELLEVEDTESVLLKDEVQKEKPLESSHAETTSLLEEKSLTEYPQENLCEETEEKIIDVVSNEDNSKDSLIQVDAREMEQGAYLEKEDANHDESINLVEPKIGNECNEDLHNASEDHKASASSEDIETTPSHKEESLVMSDNTIDQNNTEEATHENVTAEIQHVHTEENSVTQVDCSQIEQEEHLEKDGENSSWTEAPIEETKDDESKNIKELEGIDAMKAELKNEKDTESISVKEEAEVDNPIDSLPMANQDIKASDSTQDTKKCIMEQLPTANPEELSSDQTEKESVDAAEAEESLEDIVSNFPDGDNADNTPIEEDGSQEPSLEDATTDNNNAEEPSVAHEAKPVAENEKITECTSVKEEVSTESSSLVQDEETSSLEEKSLTTNPRGIMDDTKEDKTNGAIVAEEQTSEDKVQENIGETTPHENIKENLQVQEDYPQLDQKIDLENDSENTSSREVLIGEAAEGSLDNEETQVEKPLLQVPTEDKASESCQETYSIEEKALSADPEEIPCDKTEETTVDSAYTKDEELQNVENVPNEGSDNSQTEVEGQQKTSSEETSIGNNNEAESTIICDAKFADENIVKADLLGNEESIERALVKEEVPLKSFQEEVEEEKHIDSSQAAREEIKASDSSQETNCYIEEKTLPTYSQEISSDETERESIDVVSKTEERIEDIPDGDDVVNTPIQEDGSQKLYLKEATTRNDDDNESTVTKEAKLVSENEKDIESALVKEEVTTELLQVAAKDTEVTVVGQDRETSSLEVQSVTTNPQGLMDETKEDKTSDATGAEEETPENKDVATTPYEDIEENLPVEVDCKQVEENEDLVNVSEITSLTEALTGDTGEGSLVKEEAHEEKHLESLQVATEDVQASNSSQETSSVDEKILVDDSQEISCDRIEEKTIDAAYTKKENLEEVVPKISNASDEDSSPIQVDGLQKPPLEEALTIIHEANFAEESKIEADLFQNETKTECDLVKEEVSVKSSQVENEDIKPTASSEDREISHLKEQGLTTDPQETVGDYRESKTIDVTELKDKALEDKGDATTSHEDTKENSLIQVDCIQLEKNETLEDIESTLVKEEVSTELLQVAAKDTEVTVVGQDRETSSLEVQSVTTNPQGLMDETKEDKTSDAAGAEEETPEDKDVATTPYEVIEENLPVEVDCKQVEENKDLVNVSENTSLTEALTGDTGEGSLVKEEAHEEKHLESLQVATEDVQASNSSQETSSVDEKILVDDSQEISCDRIEEKTIDAAYTKKENLEEVVPKISNASDEDSSPIQVDGLQKPPLEEALTIIHEANFAEESKIEADLFQNETKTECGLVKEEVSVKSSQVENEDIKPTASSEDREISHLKEQGLTTDPQETVGDYREGKTIDVTELKDEALEDKSDATTSHEDTTENSLIQVDCIQLEKNETLEDIESTLVKEEVSTELLQVAAKDTEVTVVGQDRETSSLEVQSVTTNPQGLMDETKEDKTSDATGAEEETPEDKDVATTPYEVIEENLPVEVDCKQVEENKDLVNVSENTSLTEALTGDTGEGSLVKEEAHEEKHLESLQVATEDVQASNSSQETSSVDEKILVDDSQEISCDRIEEKTIDAAYTKKENLEEVVPKISNASDEDSSPIQVDGLQKPPLEEALTIIHEANFAEESKIEADLFQNETKTECGLVKEEVSVKSSQVENEDINPTASSEDREISHLKEQGLTTDPQETVGDYREGKTIDVTELKDEALEDKSDATTSHEDTTENSLIQVDCIELEKNETLEKASESTSLTEAPTEDTIEKAEEKDNHIETLQVATEDIKESASCQETSSIEEQILTGDSQEISCDKREEKTTNSSYTEKESFEDVATNVPSGDSEDSSPIEGDGSQKPSLKEASTENTSDHESTIQHDTKSADNLSENEKNIECDLTKEETPVKSLEVENEDTKATTSNQDRETGHMEEQGLITNPQGIVGDHTEDKVIDVTDIKKVTHEGKSYATISYEDTTENSSVQVDCSQQEQNEHSEKDNEITRLTEALATDTTEITLVKEEAQNEDHTESLKVATEDIKAFSPCQDNETSSTEEQVLIIDPEDISRDKIIEKTIDASDNEKTTEVQVENEDIKVTAPSQDKETSHLEEQGLETNPQGIIGDHKEDKTVDVPDFKEGNHEDTSYATTPHKDSKENSFVQVDCSPLEQNEHSTEALAAGIIESTVVKEEAHDEDYIESLHSATEDAKAFAPSQEEQILTVDPEDISSDKKIENITDASDKEKIFKVQEKNTEGALKEGAYTESSQEATEDIKASNSCEDRVAHSQEDQTLSANPEGLKDENRESETFPKDEMPNEIENVDFEARNIELNEEEGYLKDMSTAVNIAVHEEKDSDLIAVKIPYTEDLDVVEGVAVGHLAEEDSKQEEPSITEVPEVDMVISHENVPDAASLVSEVVEEANSCGSTMMPTFETLPETDPRGCTEAEVQFPDVEKEAELVQHDLTTETDQKDIEGQVLIKDSQVISESVGVNDEEEKTNSDNCEEISGSSNSGVLEEESASNFQESRREMKEEAENEEAQKQEEELHVSALVHDSSSRKIESHVQELEKAPLPASDENIIETECNESETVEDAIIYKEGVDRTESLFDEKKATEREQEETESGQEKSTSDENIQTTTSTSDLEVIDFLPVLPSETSKVDLSSTEGEIATDKEELNAGKIASDANEDTRIDNNRSITDLESINDDEAEVKQTTPPASEGQDVESTRVGETTSLISECNRDGHENDNTSSATEESPDSKVVLESVSQVAETEETKTEGKNLETAGEIESERIVAEDISGQEESKHETEILKTKEENEVVVHQACHQEEVIIGSHLEEEANQEEISTGLEDIKKENETEKVTEISKEADDKAFKEPEETLLGNESIDSEINMSSVAFPGKEENRTRADDTENEIAEDEGLLNQNSKIPVIDAAERELPKELDENITCEAPINTFDKTIDDSEVKKEQQEEHITRKHEILTLPELVQGKDSEKYNQKDEICGLDEVQPRDEENVTHSEEKSEEERKGDTWSKPKEGEETETHVEPEQFDFSFHIKDISKVPSSDDAQVIPEDKESHTTKNSPEEECSNKSTLEFENQQVKLHDLPRELNIMDTEVMAEKDDPENLQNARDVSQDDQGPNEGSSEVSIKENPVEASQDENIKTSEEQETEAVQNASVLETLEQETEEQQLGRTPGNVTEAGVDCEEEKIINDKSNQLENSRSAGTEKVSESNTCQNLMDVTARHDKVEGSPRQIGSLSILPEVKCSEIETTERDIPVHSDGVNGTGVAELEVTPIPSKDKHIVLEADHTTVLNSENANGNEKLSAECSQGEHDLLEPSKVEQKEADCGNEARTDQETTEKTEAKEADKPSLSDLLSMRETSKMAEHSAIGEEPTTHTEDRYAEKPDEDQDENAKTEEEHDDKDEHKESESSSEAPVMVDMADADVKVSHKKSHNILSGVGSKVKHSIAKVKKVITGKSSHPKPPSPVKYAS